MTTTVPPATFKVLFVLVILRHDRRRILHFNVTEHPTAAWTARQLLEACGAEEAPTYLLRDRDSIYGEMFRRQVEALKIQEICTAPRTPWQNPYAERVIGSIRRECLDHMIVLASVISDEFSQVTSTTTTARGLISPYIRTRRSDG